MFNRDFDIDCPECECECEADKWYSHYVEASQDGLEAWEKVVDLQEEIENINIAHQEDMDAMSTEILVLEAKLKVYEDMFGLIFGG